MGHRFELWRLQEMSFTQKVSHVYGTATADMFQAAPPARLVLALQDKTAAITPVQHELMQLYLSFFKPGNVVSFPLDLFSIDTDVLAGAEDVVRALSNFDTELRENLKAG